VDKAGTTAVVVFARAPVAGASKTRLIPALGEKAAADLHARMIEHTLETLGNVFDDYALQLWCAPDTSHPLFARLADRYVMSLHTQRGDNLGARMYHALDTALLEHDHAIVIGTDCPGLASADIVNTVDALKNVADVVIGPATDGGYWLLGVRAVSATLFRDIAWGSTGCMNRHSCASRLLAGAVTLCACGPTSTVRKICPGFRRTCWKA
jgi:rSAM/selenodomain-associated transferase 1